MGEHLVFPVYSVGFSNLLTELFKFLHSSWKTKGEMNEKGRNNWKKRKRKRPVFLWLNKRGQTSPVQEASQCQNRQGSIFSFQLPEPLKKPIMDINKSKYTHKRKSLTLSKKKNQIIFKKSTKLSQKNPNIQNPLILDLKGHKTGRKIVQNSKLWS